MHRIFTYTLLLAVSAALYAQPTMEDTIKLDDVTISVIPYHKKIKTATAAIGLINTSKIDIDHTVNIAEFINLVPGVYMASGAYNTNRLIIRGVGSRTPYSTNRIRAYLDDIPLTNGDGNSTLEDIDASMIGNLEILKGPSSALSGSGLGGVVKISSRYPAVQGFSAMANSEFGSFGTSRTYANAGIKKERLTLFTGFARTLSNGYRENSRYLRNNFLLNVKNNGEYNQFSLTLNIVDLNAEIPSSLNEEDFLNNPQKAAGNWLAVKGFEDYLKVQGGLSINTDFSDKVRNSFVLYSQYNNPYESRPFNILDEKSLSAGLREAVEIAFERTEISAGVEYFQEAYQWQIYQTEGGAQGSLQTDNSETRQFLNLFTYSRFEPNERLAVEFGLNLNMLNYGLETHFNADSIDQSGTYGYNPVLSPRLGINYRYAGENYLYLSAGHGFSAPSVEEALLPEGNINTDLKPETGWNFEIGNRSFLFNNRLNIDLTLYTVYLRNLLVTKRVTEDIFSGINAGSALNSGLEFLGTYNLLAPSLKKKYALNLNMNYAFSHNRFLDFVDDGEDFSGNELPGIPTQILQVALDGSLYQLMYFRFQHKFTGIQQMNDANSQAYEGYHLSDFQISFRKRFSRLPMGIKIYAGIRNIFDTHYASMILVNAPSFGSNPPRYYYPGLPRNFYAGLSINFN